MKHFLLKRQYLRIYLVIVVIFSIIYTIIFVINRLQYIHEELKWQRNSIFSYIKDTANLNELIDSRQTKYFINHAKWIEFLYTHHTKYLNALLQENVFYSFIGVVGLDGKYKYANDFTFKQLVNNTNTRESIIENKVVHDEHADKTYKFLSYPIFVKGKLEGYIVAYLDMNFLLDSENVYLISQDSYVLNNDYLNDIQLGHKNLSFIYPNAWDKIKDKSEGQFIQDSVIFTFKSIEALDITIDGYKINREKRYLTSIIKMNPDDNPYNISSIRAFLKYANFKEKIEYWIFAYIWLLLSSVFLFIIIVNKIKAGHLNSLDQMTGAYNRRKGFAILNRLIKDYNAKKHNIFSDIIFRILQFKKPLSSLHICLVDIDNLKQVNDNLGHKYGDELIIGVIRTIDKHLKKNEFIIRIGGDEFIVIFINRNIIDIEDIWREIAKEFMEKNNSKQLRYTIRASKGIFEYQKGMDIDSCIAEADKLMYQDKRTHKINLFFN